MLLTRLFELAAQGLFRRRLRSIITLASVVVGTAGLLLFIAVASGLQQQIQLQLGSYEPATVLHVDPPLTPAATSANSGPPPGIDDTLLQRMRSLPHVRAAFPELQVGGTAKLGSTELPLALRPVPASYVSGGAGVRLLAGRVFTADDAREVVISAGFANVLAGDGGGAGPSSARVLTTGPASPNAATPQRIKALVGQALQFTPDANGGPAAQAASLQIVGVVDSRDPYAFVPFTTGTALQPPDPSGAAASYDAAIVQVSSVEDVAAARQEIEGLHLHIETPDTLAKSLSNALGLARVIAAVIAAIGLLLAVINITNMLLAAVHERAREIGIMKAVGARNWHVGLLFLLESLLVGVLGGILGSGLAILVARLIGVLLPIQLPDSPPLTLVIPAPAVLLALAAVTLLSALAGSLPALRAARIEPAVAIAGV